MNLRGLLRSTSVTGEANRCSLMLTAYLLKVANLYYALCPKEVRKLASGFALKNNKTVPKSWTDIEMAGVDLVHGFP